jgi:hypothetical protein
MAKATREPTSTTTPQQMSRAELSALAKRLRNRAESIVLRDQPEMQRDMLTAAGVVDGVVRSSDLLVDITDADGKVSRSVPLWEAIGDDEVEYQDCRTTLLADGKSRTKRRTASHLRADERDNEGCIFLAPIYGINSTGVTSNFRC